MNVINVHGEKVKVVLLLLQALPATTDTHYEMSVLFPADTTPYPVLSTTALQHFPLRHPLYICV